MRYRYTTQDPYNTHPFKTGAPLRLNGDLDLNYARYLALENARLKWLIKQTQRQRSSILDVSDLQANLLAEIGEQLCTCMAFRDTDGTQLTANAQRYWQVFTWEKAMPPYVGTTIPNYPIGGLIGSIASYITLPNISLDLNQSDLEVSQSLIKSIWQELDLGLDVLPLQRLQRLLLSIDFDIEYIKSSNAGLVSYFKTSPPNVRRAALDAKAVSNLPLRILLGEFNNSLIEIWAKFQLLCNQDSSFAAEHQQPTNSYQKSYHLMQMGLTLGRGGGAALLFQALYLENLLQIYQQLTPYSDRSLADFTSQSATLNIRGQVALHYAAAADATSSLALFNTQFTAESKAQQLWFEAGRWEATLPSSYRIEDSGWRLTELLKQLAPDR
jgi:hypothetical protein